MVYLSSCKCPDVFDRGVNMKHKDFYFLYSSDCLKSGYKLSGRFNEF